MTKTLIRLAASAVLVCGVGAATAFADPGRGGHEGSGPDGFGPGRIDFEAIDANADGRLERAELLARASDRIAAFDLDGNGQIDRAELIAALPAREGLHAVFAENPAQRMAERILALHGATAQGAVPVAQMAEQRTNKALAAFDEDGDGVLVLEEVERPDRPRGRDRGPHGEGPRRG